MHMEASIGMSFNFWRRSSFKIQMANNDISTLFQSPWELKYPHIKKERMYNA